MTGANHHQNVPYPNNALTARLDRVESRQDNTEITVSSLIATTAVHTSEFSNVKEDIRNLSVRLDRILMALWSIVLVLIPVAISMIAGTLGQ